MEFSRKKNKKKKIIHRTDDKEDGLLIEQPKMKKKSKRQFSQEDDIQINDEVIYTPSKKSKKKKNKLITNTEENEPLCIEINNKKRRKEEFSQRDNIEVNQHPLLTPSKKTKNRKIDYFPNVEEDEELTDQSTNKKISKKAFNQFEIMLTEGNVGTPSKKVKQKKNYHNVIVEGDALLGEQLKNKKKSTVECKEIETSVFQACTDEHEDSPTIKAEDIDGGSWEKEDYLELIRRMESQIPKTDTTSFSNRVNKINWNEVQFGDHSIEECKEKWKVLRSKVRHYRLLSEVLQDAKTWAENPWSLTTTNRRRTKHPEQPSRPLSSYMLFYMDKKKKIIKKNPNLKMTDISKLVGEKYNALPEHKKAYYVEKAKLMQEEYKKNIEKFYEKYPQLTRAANTKKEKSKPKKPLTPFKLYFQDKLQKHETDEHFNRQAVMEKYKELWKTLSTKKKGFWIRLAKEEEDKYLEQLQDSFENGSNHVTCYKTVLSKEEYSILDRIAGKPEKPPNSAYTLFCTLMLQNKDDNYVEGEPTSRMKEVANKWKELPEEQKKLYAQEVQHMQDNYKLEFANYLESLPEDKRAEELAKVSRMPKKRSVKLKQKTVNKGSELAMSPKKEHFTNNEPDKPPVTAWDLYKNEFINKNTHLPSNVAYKKAAATWKTLSTKEIEKYKKKHEQIKEKYLKDFAAFLERMNEDELKEYYAIKGDNSREHELNEESADEESSVEDEENDSEESDSDESDSGVSEGEK